MAARTYRLNHPGVPDDRVIVQDIRALATRDLQRLAGEQAARCPGGIAAMPGVLLGRIPLEEDPSRLPARG